MAGSEQIKSLFRSHLAGDDEHFYAVGLQLAAHEARRGHTKLAGELRDIIMAAKSKRATAAAPATKVHSIAQPRGELSSLLEAQHPKSRLSDLIVDESISAGLQRIVREHRSVSRIREHGLHPRRKLLLIGPPGTGKTLTASVLAGELGIPLYTVRLDGLITKFMGETAAKLRQIFAAMSEARGVYFFDEFDSIGAQRSQGHDVGEIRRVLNSFLVMLEQDKSASLIVAATNHPDVLDHALFRRFDDALAYGLPDAKRITALLKCRTQGFAAKGIKWAGLAKASVGLSHADITRAAEEAIKDALIHDREQITEDDLHRTLEERRTFTQRLTAR